MTYGCEFHPWTEGLAVMECRNCAGEQWVCEHHQDMPWESSGHAENCGAGAPCPVCNREMACAPYRPQWQPIETAPKNCNEVLICGGLYFDPRDWITSGYPFDAVAIARWDSTWKEWQGRPVSHDDCISHEPTHWMSLPEPASGMEARQGGDSSEAPSRSDDSPTAATSGGDARKDHP